MSVAGVRYPRVVFALIGIIGLAALVTLLLPARDSALYRVISYQDGDRLHLQSAVDSKFVRVDGSSKRLLLTEERAWLHGGTFEVVKRRVDDECFQLKTGYGTWLALNAESQEVVAESESGSEGTYFSAIDSSQEPYLSSSLRLPNVPGADLSTSVGRRRLGNILQTKSVKLKVCTQSTWFNVGRSSGLKSASFLTLKAGETSPTPSSFRSLLSWFSSLPKSAAQGSAPSEILSKNSSSSSSNSDLFSPSVFIIHELKQVRGVNLGGWFIPEVWMTPEFFNDTGLGWGGSLCAITKQNQSVAEARMRHVVETFITEKDMEEIAAMGFNSVRLPVGYWNIIKDPYHRYSPSDEKFSLRYIDWAFDAAAKYGLTVLLDLHGAPGSQNGQDHSGCNMRPEFMKRSNVDLALKAIGAMAQRYGSHPALLGFELLNEPAFEYSQMNHSVLLRYYTDAYHLVRAHSPDSIIVFNELYDFFYSWWDSDLVEPAFYNVMIDLHLYNWQANVLKETKTAHILDAMRWKGVVEALSKHHPVIVGEWCMSTGTWMQVGQAFVNAVVKSFDRAAGWYMWTWKIQRGIGFNEWDVQYEHQIHGLDPLQVYTKWGLPGQK